MIKKIETKNNVLMEKIFTFYKRWKDGHKFENKIFSLSKIRLLSNYKTLFENKNFVILNNSINNNRILKTANSEPIF